MFIKANRRMPNDFREVLVITNTGRILTAQRQDYNNNLWDCPNIMDYEIILYWAELES